MHIFRKQADPSAQVYEGTQSLNYVDNYAHGSSQWEGFPIEVDVPSSSILVGAKGRSTTSDIMTLARESVARDLAGIMVWYCSVVDGLLYQGSQTWDGSQSDDSIQAYKEARKYFDSTRKMPLA